MRDYRFLGLNRRFITHYPRQSDRSGRCCLIIDCFCSSSYLGQIHILHTLLLCASKRTTQVNKVILSSVVSYFILLHCRFRVVEKRVERVKIPFTKQIKQVKFRKAFIFIIFRKVYFTR